MIVVDSSTLILMTKTELLDLFLVEYKQSVFVPEAVEKESTIKKTFDAIIISQRILQNKIVVKKVKNPKLIRNLSKDFALGLGEAETLALCIEHNGKLVGTDDYNAIKACTALQIKYFSSISFLIKMREAGKIDKKQALAVLEKLEEFGRYSKEIIIDAKNRINEVK